MEICVDAAVASEQPSEQASIIGEAEEQHTCDMCGSIFAKRNQLFKHLRTHGVFPENEVTYVRVGLLVGWFSRSPDGDADVWIRDGALTYGQVTAEMDDVETALWEAVKAVEGVAPDDEHAARPKGLSRASSCALRGLERSTHGIGDLISMQLKQVPLRTFDSAWVSAVNAHLSDFIRVHEVFLMPKIGDFHAEVSCSQRVYEYMFPMHTLMQEPEGNSAAAAPILELLRRHGITKTQSDLTFVDDSFAAANDSDISGVRGPKKPMGDWETKRPRNKMDQMFRTTGDEETECTRKRITFFRNLKVIFKKYAGKHGFHNFAAGGASPDDSVTVRRVDRIYHKELHEFDASSIESLAAVAGAAGAQTIGVKRMQHPVRTDGDYSNLWTTVSASGDSFLRGQVCVHLMDCV
jgi:tRNA U38,U39,U40 pseudouridine synthase TruA